MSSLPSVHFTSSKLTGGTSSSLRGTCLRVVAMTGRAGTSRATRRQGSESITQASTPISKVSIPTLGSSLSALSGMRDLVRGSSEFLSFYPDREGFFLLRREFSRYPFWVTVFSYGRSPCRTFARDRYRGATGRGRDRGTRSISVVYQTYPLL